MAYVNHIRSEEVSDVNALSLFGADGYPVFYTDLTLEKKFSGHFTVTDEGHAGEYVVLSRALDIENSLRARFKREAQWQNPSANPRRAKPRNIWNLWGVLSPQP